MIDQQTIDRILDAADVVDVVQDFVHLKKKGTNYTGLCPFHDEKTPSFMVSPAKGIFKCFGCGKGGNVVNFVMEHEVLSYPEALKFLAKKYNIEVVEDELTPEDIQRNTERESMLIVTAYAQKYFTEQLLHGKEGLAVGMSYFKERGFQTDMIRKFDLGYCPEGRDAFTKDALEKGYKKDYLIKTGLTIDKNEFRYDRFSARVMFPIHNLAGKVIAFGGRTLRTDKKIAKYLNSPESEIYHKSNVLYGIYHAKRSVTQNDKCYLVEGYTDVISFHQSGIENVVASSGTALTPNQIRLIKRFTPNVTVIYDGDSAGIKASMRGIDLILEEGMNVKVVSLPEGEDPDSFAKSHSASELEKFIRENETDFISFKTKLLLDDAKSDPVERARLISEIVRSISIIPDRITRSVYIGECSAIMNIEEKVLYAEVAKVIGGKIEKQKTRIQNTRNQIQKPTPAKNEGTAKKDDNYFLEENIIEFFLKYGEKDLFPNDPEDESAGFIKVADFIIEEFEHDELELEVPFMKLFFEDLCEQYKLTGTIDHDRYVHHENKEIRRLVADLLSSKYIISKFWTRHSPFIELPEDKLAESVPEIILKFKNVKIDRSLKELQQEVNQATKDNDEERMMDALRRFQVLNMLRNELSKRLGGRIIL